MNTDGDAERPITTIMPPNTPASRRAVPSHPTPTQVANLRALLDQDSSWVLRGDWDRYLRTGSRTRLRPVSTLTRDQRAAALAWLRQQRHNLHRAVEGGRQAPDGWLESLPLYRALL